MSAKVLPFRPKPTPAVELPSPPPLPPAAEYGDLDLRLNRFALAALHATLVVVTAWVELWSPKR